VEKEVVVVARKLGRKEEGERRWEEGRVKAVAWKEERRRRRKERKRWCSCRACRLVILVAIVLGVPRGREDGRRGGRRLKQHSGGGEARGKKCPSKALKNGHAPAKL